jgi:hypothetical protein
LSRQHGTAGDGEAFADWSDTEGRPPQEVPLPADLPLG